MARKMLYGKLFSLFVLFVMIEGGGPLTFVGRAIVRCCANLAESHRDGRREHGGEEEEEEEMGL